MCPQTCRPLYNHTELLILCPRQYSIGTRITNMGFPLAGRQGAYRKQSNFGHMCLSPAWVCLSTPSRCLPFVRGLSMSVPLYFDKC